MKSGQIRDTNLMPDSLNNIINFVNHPSGRSTPTNLYKTLEAGKTSVGEKKGNRISSPGGLRLMEVHTAGIKD